MPEVIMNGPEGRLEGRFYPAKEPNSPVAIILHPHPQHGGSMNNKVVYTLYQLQQTRQSLSETLEEIQKEEPL